jgi:hypothetical protein
VGRGCGHSGRYHVSSRRAPLPAPIPHLSCTLCTPACNADTINYLALLSLLVLPSLSLVLPRTRMDRSAKHDLGRWQKLESAETPMSVIPTLEIL